MIKLIENVVKEISKKHKDVIVKWFMDVKPVDNVVFRFKYYNKKSDLYLSVSDIYKASFPEKYLIDNIENHIKKLKRG